MANDAFDRIDAMLRMVPLSRLQCPSCNAHGEDDFDLIRWLKTRVPLLADGPSKIITLSSSVEEVEDVISEEIRCVCGGVFPVPDNWTVVNRISAKAPSGTAAANKAAAKTVKIKELQEALAQTKIREAAKQKWKEAGGQPPTPNRKGN